MKHSIAANLIKNGVTQLKKQDWVELGAGSGLFTQTLGNLIPSGTIRAIDLNEQALNSIVWKNTAVKLIRQVGDFENVAYAEKYNGFLLANSLHYIEPATQLLHKIKQALQPDGRIIIIEYESDAPNMWVPFPIPFSKLKDMAAEIDMSVIKMEHTASQYHKGGIYSALLRF